MSLLVAWGSDLVMFFKVEIIMVQSNDMFMSSLKQREEGAYGVQMFNVA